MIQVCGEGVYMHVIPHSWAHLHILVSVFPSVGLLFALLFYVAAFLTDNETLKRICLARLWNSRALFAIPTYLSGERLEGIAAADPKINQEWIATHEGWGLAALLMLVSTGLAAFIDLAGFAASASPTMRRIWCSASPSSRSA